MEIVFSLGAGVIIIPNNINISRLNMFRLVNYYVPPKNRLHKSTINQVEKPVITTNWTGIIICES